MKKLYFTMLCFAFLLFSAQEVTAQSIWNNPPQEKGIKGLSVFPNPLNTTTNTFLTIQSSLNANKNIAFYDVLGKRIFATFLRGKQLNISNLKPGIYILKVTENNISETRKLVIK
ncbi:T9SS type A sorting domain-containing protein [Flavobacteriaceae bacterium GSB9]|nr:T9SS type A sorting domain-containing protein [Flavobacteriaceae bacterium GSB9]